MLIRSAMGSGRDMFMIVLITVIYCITACLSRDVGVMWAKKAPRVRRDWGENSRKVTIEWVHSNCGRRGNPGLEG